MTDLIFHIGLAKCASSTLQRQVFRHEEGFLGRAPGVFPELNLAGELLKCGPFVGRQTIDRRGLAQWADRVRHLKAECCPHSERLILSEEILSAASRLDDRPILKVLSLLRNQIWEEGRIQVVLVLRSQAMRLASSYAQNSNCSWEPGQLDFERSVARYLSSRRHLRLLDYSKWIDGLNAILGPDNVCPLLLEEARTLDFWRQLSKFCHLKKFEPSNMVHEDGGNENVRRRAENSWAIQPLDTIFRARSTTEKYLNLIWPAIIAPKARMRCVDWSVQTLDARYKRKANRMDTARRESEIELSRKVMETIRDACGPANDRLGEQLGRNLKPLGY